MRENTFIEGFRLRKWITWQRFKWCVNKGKGCKLSWFWKGNTNTLVDFLSCNEFKPINPEQTTTVILKCILRHLWNTPSWEFFHYDITTTAKTYMKSANTQSNENSIYAMFYKLINFSSFNFYYSCRRQ